MAQSLQPWDQAHVAAIRQVAATLSENGHDRRIPHWSGSIYFEDISSESDFGLIEIIVGTTLETGAL
ncbi:MAG: hypothetical protein JKY00_12910 [Roseicyclus sp.]|nr:hypothetical protein [Roseicyclus sp.]